TPMTSNPMKRRAGNREYAPGSGDFLRCLGRLASQIIRFLGPFRAAVLVFLAAASLASHADTTTGRILLSCDLDQVRTLQYQSTRGMDLESRLAPKTGLGSWLVFKLSEHETGDDVFDDVAGTMLVDCSRSF